MRQMGLSQAHTAEEDRVGLLFDEVQAEEILDLRPVDLLRPVPLELIEGLDEREAGPADALIEALVLAAGDLALDQVLQVLEWSPTAVRRRLGELMVVGAQERQLQAQQSCSESGGTAGGAIVVRYRRGRHSWSGTS